MALSLKVHVHKDVSNAINWKTLLKNLSLVKWREAIDLALFNIAS